VVKIHNIQRLLERRRELRTKPTSTEEKLWWYLKNKRLGVKFRRQHSIGGYILDFICKEKRLIIEIDGIIHQTPEAREYDKVRDKFFTELDYKVLRFKNDEVENDTNEVVAKIKTCLLTIETAPSLP
jgi:very-short-patch-repair endonuclease